MRISLICLEMIFSFYRVIVNSRSEVFPIFLAISGVLRLRNHVKVAHTARFRHVVLVRMEHKLARVMILKLKNVPLGGTHGNHITFAAGG